MSGPREHGGGLDAAIVCWGGSRGDWIDLSTGINPCPYPVGELPPDCWTALPDASAFDGLAVAARNFWSVPDGAAVLAGPGASSLIARIPALVPPGQVQVAQRTYNEHANAFDLAGWTVSPTQADARVIVHPNNPDGQLWDGADERPGDRPLLVIDESFCDVVPERSHIAMADRSGVIVLKGFGKFWGLAGMRLGFAIGDPALIGRLSDMLGPWQVSGPALHVATTALRDRAWAADTRTRLERDAARLDAMAVAAGCAVVGGTSLFRLYQVASARALQDHLAAHRIWSRVFSYDPTWIRLGLPGDVAAWDRLQTALDDWA